MPRSFGGLPLVVPPTPAGALGWRLRALFEWVLAGVFCCPDALGQRRFFECPRRAQRTVRIDPTPRSTVHRCPVRPAASITPGAPVFAAAVGGDRHWCGSRGSLTQMLFEPSANALGGRPPDHITRPCPTTDTKNPGLRSLPTTTDRPKLNLLTAFDGWRTPAIGPPASLPFGSRAL